MLILSLDQLILSLGQLILSLGQLILSLGQLIQLISGGNSVSEVGGGRGKASRISDITSLSFFGPVNFIFGQVNFIFGPVNFIFGPVNFIFGPVNSVNFRRKFSFRGGGGGQSFTNFRHYIALLGLRLHTALRKPL